ncbi:MAG: hypothetical protein ACPGZU_15250, partial [Ketobacter sp.]
MSGWKHWLATRLGKTQLQQRIVELERENHRLQREMQVLNKVKDVADRQRQYSESLLEEQLRIRDLWFATASTLDNIRHTVASGSENMRDQRAKLNESQTNYGQIKYVLQGVADSLLRIDGQNQEAIQEVQTLADVGLRIDKFITQINEISDQTN